MEHLVYKLTGSNGLIYIGITYLNGIENRISCHKRKTFKDVDFTFEILHKSNNRQLIENLEEVEIKKHKSYDPNIGLNKTMNGKGYNYSSGFTTKGFKFSEESKLKMKKSAKLRIRKRGYKLSEETVRKMSERNKGKISWSKLNINQVKEIKKIYLEKPVLPNVGKTQKNGRTMSYDQEFAKTYSIIYNVTPQCIKHIITKRSWSNV
jgi:hypothetical protein